MLWYLLCCGICGYKRSVLWYLFVHFILFPCFGSLDGGPGFDGPLCGWSRVPHLLFFQAQPLALLISVWTFFALIIQSFFFIYP